MLNGKGITIVEVLIVMLITATLAIWLLPVLLGVEVRAMFPQMIIDVKETEERIDRYIVKHGWGKTGIGQFEIIQHLLPNDYFYYRLDVDITPGQEEWRLYVIPKETPSKNLCYRRIARDKKEWVIYRRHLWANYLRLPNTRYIKSKKDLRPIE